METRTYTYILSHELKNLIYDTYGIKVYYIDSLIPGGVYFESDKWIYDLEPVEISNNFLKAERTFFEVEGHFNELELYHLLQDLVFCCLIPPGDLYIEIEI